MYPKQLPLQYLNKPETRGLLTARVIDWRISEGQLISSMKSVFIGIPGLTLAFLSMLTQAQSLMLSPGTLVLNEQRRAAAISVGTTGDRLTTFEVNNSFFIQQSDGQLMAADPTTAEGTAVDFVRVGPRRFVAEPGRGQQVRVAVRPPRDLTPGEYRMHLTVVSAGDSDATPTESVTTETDSGMRVVIPVRVARAVRVLYRHRIQPEGGDVNAVRRRHEGTDAAIDFEVSRKGKTSLIAETEILAMSSRGTILSRWPGPAVSVYTENERRDFSARVPITEIPPNANLCVRLTVTDEMAQGLSTVTRCAD